MNNPIKLNPNGLKARLEAYYSVVAPATLDESWDSRFNEIYKK